MIVYENIYYSKFSDIKQLLSKIQDSIDNRGEKWECLFIMKKIKLD